MKQLITSIGNQSIYGVLVILTNTLLRTLGAVLLTILAGILLACFWLGMTEFVERVPAIFLAVKSAFL